MDDSATEHAHPWFAAVYDPVTAWVERLVFRRHRAYLTENLSGPVLDIGSGTGAMFTHYGDRLESGATTVHAVEPDPHMLEQAREKATELDVDIELQRAAAESLPFADDTFDTVIGALVFCTIGDAEQALSEIHRVLSPDGEFRFFEHVRDTGWRQSVQTALNPVWKRAVGGCNLVRDTQRLFASEPDFEVAECQQFRDGLVPVNPFIRGVLCPTTTG